MSVKNDRSMGTSGPLWIVLVAVALIIAAAAGLFLWKRSRPAAPAATAVSETGLSPAAAMPGERLSVTLFIPAAGALKTVTAEIPRQPDVQLEAREAIKVLLGVSPDAPAVLRDLALRGCYLDAGGTVFADLAAAGSREIRASARDELLALYAIVNTLAQNFAEVRQVRILVDGREAQTLAGHIDLSRPLSKRTDLVRP